MSPTNKSRVNDSELVSFKMKVYTLQMCLILSFILVTGDMNQQFFVAKIKPQETSRRT